ncbi:MAG: DNA double-strand break repair Rad50 ATPase, partial [uncultured Rubrobacteraceae bacterium]
DPGEALPPELQAVPGADGAPAARGRRGDRREERLGEDHDLRVDPVGVLRLPRRRPALRERRDPLVRRHRRRQDGRGRDAEPGRKLLQGLAHAPSRQDGGQDLRRGRGGTVPERLFGGRGVGADAASRDGPGRLRGHVLRPPEGAGVFRRGHRGRAPARGRAHPRDRSGRGGAEAPPGRPEGTQGPSRGPRKHPRGHGPRNPGGRTPRGAGGARPAPGRCEAPGRESSGGDGGAREGTGRGREARGRLPAAQRALARACGGRGGAGTRVRAGRRAEGPSRGARRG